MNCHVIKSKFKVHNNNSSQYTTVLEILLNQDIAKDRICMKKPSGITCSASYVVDVRTLDCLDDIKKDEFGIWNYSGSHPRGFRVFHKNGRMVIEKCANGAVGSNIFYLRRLHCTHPSDAEFKRMISFVYGKSNVG